MTQASRVLDYLWSISPDGASNSQIARAVGISSHQTVYMLTQQLVRRGLVHGVQASQGWTFFAREQPDAILSADPGSAGSLLPSGDVTILTPRQFENLARRELSQRFGTWLPEGTVSGVRKKFDFVSADRTVVGDAKYITLVGGVGLPPAKFSVIAEHVWLLEKTEAASQFLVFGNDRAVPTRWLDRYGTLTLTVDFYFMTDDGCLEVLRSANLKATS